MLSKQRQNRFYLVARVNDHRFMRALIANNRTVALDRSNREYFVDHAYIVTSTAFRALAWATEVYPERACEPMSASSYLP
jgi:hypothetical protein